MIHRSPQAPYRMRRETFFRHGPLKLLGITIKGSRFRVLKIRPVLTIHLQCLNTVTTSGEVWGVIRLIVWFYRGHICGMRSNPSGNDEVLMHELAVVICQNSVGLSNP